MMLTIEISLGILCATFIFAAGCWKLYRGATTTAPHLEAVCAIFVFSVLGSLGGTQMLAFASTVPASAVTQLDLDSAWDDSVVVRWAALMKKYGESKQLGVSLTEIQSAMLLAVTAFLSMRLIHHVVVILRLLKVARRNQMHMLKKEIK